ncbi:MAG: hypothetical protein RLZZ519_2501, partial [Bacteroidota bacterium]
MIFCRKVNQKADGRFGIIGQWPNFIGQFSTHTLALCKNLSSGRVAKMHGNRLTITGHSTIFPSNSKSRMQAFFRQGLIRMLCAIAWVALLLGTQTLSAQGDHRNLEKYWRYRQRLHELFVKVGPGPGESIPAAEINQFRKVFGIPGVTYGQADGTATLGWYIAVLASEHALLVRNGLSTAENEEELYFALNALWRLDAQSNFYSYLTGDWPACTTLTAGAPMGPMSAMDYDDDNILDGYAIRSDAQSGFHTNFPGMVNTSSEVLSPYGRNCRSKEMSQDQAIFLIMG